MLKNIIEDYKSILLELKDKINKLPHKNFDINEAFELGRNIGKYHILDDIIKKLLKIIKEEK
jgi:hypothetical protein